MKDIILSFLPITILAVLTVFAAWGLNKLLAKTVSKEHKKGKVKKYAKCDANVPMAYFYFYIAVRPIFSCASFASNVINNTGIADPFMLIGLLELLTYICACVGLYKRKYWGYKLNKVFLVVEIVGGALVFALNILLEADNAAQSIVNFLGVAIVNILSMVYFNKRELLFTDDDKVLYRNASEERAVVNTCSKCGGSFKVNISQNDKFTCKIYAVCPHCKSKELVFTPAETRSVWRKKMEWKNRMLDISMLPKAVELNRESLLPQCVNRQYGYGKRFNAFMLSEESLFYHKSRCPIVKGKQKQLIHRYSALKNAAPCPKCRPNAIIDAWYIDFLRANFDKDIMSNEFRELFSYERK